MSCGYEGLHFGARYPDACCVDGYLWDLDSCDEPGGPLYRGGDIACPCCNTSQYVSDAQLSGNAGQRRVKRRALIRKVLSWAARTSQGEANG